MSSLVGTTKVLIDFNKSYNPDKLPANQACYFIDPVTGNTSASQKDNCDGKSNNGNKVIRLH